MIKLIIEKLLRVTKNRKKLEKDLEVKITNRGKEVYITGEPENEYFAEKVIQALELGFPYATAISIKKQDLVFEILSLKNYTRSKNLARVRARIIGTKGKTLQTLTELTDCAFELKENQIGIIGEPENIKQAEEAIISLVRGAKQGNVYAGAMKLKAKLKIQEFEDLGLKKKDNL